MPTVRPAGVFVLGMHRSGTSAAVLGLESLGFALCSETDRLRAGLGNSNPDHGESLSVIAENDALLDLFNGSWLHPRLEPAWLDDERVTARATAAAAKFTAVHPDTPWAVKDPRLCLTLPYWEQALGARYPVLIVVRHPLEIVKSLQARESGQDPHHPASYYLALWERYTRSALINTAHHPAYVLNYSDLLADWSGMALKLTQWLQHNGLPGSLPPEAPVKPELHRARASSLAGLTTDQRRLHQLTLALNGPHHRLRVPNLSHESPRTSALFGPGPDRASAGYLGLQWAKPLRHRLALINPLVTKRTAVIGLAIAGMLSLVSEALMQLTRLGHTTGPNDWITTQLLRVQWPTVTTVLKFAGGLSAKAYLDWVAIFATVVLILLRKRSAAAILLLGLLAEELLTDLLRSPMPDPAGVFAPKTFRAAVLLGLLAYFGFRLVQARIWRFVIAGLCLLLIALVALGRVYFGVHDPSAVLASLMLGAAVTVLLASLFEAVQKSPHRVPPQRRPSPAKLTTTMPLDDIS